MKGAEQKAKTLLAETTAFADLSSSLDYDAAPRI